MKNSRSSRRGGSSDPPAARQGTWLRGCPEERSQGTDVKNSDQRNESARRGPAAPRRGGSPDPPTREGQRGQTLLEFALVAPLLIFFILALVDFGIAIDRRLALDHAVREGARYASVGATELTGDRDADAVRDYAFEQAQEIPSGPGDFQVCLGTVVGEQTVQVRIDYAYELVTPIGALAGLAFDSIPIHASASARVEQPLTDADTVEECLDG